MTLTTFLVYLTIMSVKRGMWRLDTWTMEDDLVDKELCVMMSFFTKNEYSPLQYTTLVPLLGSHYLLPYGLHHLFILHSIAHMFLLYVSHVIHAPPSSNGRGKQPYGYYILLTYIHSSFCNHQCSTPTFSEIRPH